ncbi:MAG: PAS domain S-box protein [Gammaproteobacteria bacterium]
MFESLVVELSDDMIRARPEATRALIDAWLARLASFFKTDRITLWELSEDGEKIFRRHMHTRTGCELPPTEIPSRSFSWLLDQNRRGKTVSWSRIPEDVPEDASSERGYARLIGAKSLLSLPVFADSVLCVLALTSLRKYQKWTPAKVRRLRLISVLLASAIARERSDAARRATEARNRAILTALPDLMLVLSPDGVYIEYHCRQDWRFFSPPEKLLGRRLDEVLPPEVAAIFGAAHSAATKSDGVVAVEYALCIDGRQCDFEARMARRDDGAVVCLVRDVTERSRAARRLRESEERFRGAFEHSAIGIAIVSLQGRWLQGNPASCRILGYTEAELQSKCFQELTHPDDLAANLHDFERAMRGEIDHYELEKRYIHKNGRTVPALLTVSIVRDERGRPLYFVSQLQDLTDRKRAQTEIERLRVELKHFDRISLTGQLTASLAHEVMQPIAAIMANAESCQRSLQDGESDSPDFRQSIDDIISCSGRAADIVSNVRNLLRKEPGTRRRVNLNRLTQDLIEVTRHELALRKVQLETRLDESLREMMGNPIELQQVILNLLMNGAEALERAQGLRELTLETANRGAGIEIAVRDSGRDFDPAILERIFEPFFTTKAEGMGMGLTICAEIVQAHGGRIWADTNADGELTVHCLFEAAEPDIPG